MYVGHEVLMEVDYYFNVCCLSRRDFELAAQASPNPNPTPIEYAPIHLSLEEVATHAGHEVLMEVDFNPPYRYYIN
jgi:hypothetical protein